MDRRKEGRKREKKKCYSLFFFLYYYFVKYTYIFILHSNFPLLPPLLPLFFPPLFLSSFFFPSTQHPFFHLIISPHSFYFPSFTSFFSPLCKSFPPLHSTLLLPLIKPSLTLLPLPSFTCLSSSSSKLHTPFS